MQLNRLPVAIGFGCDAFNSASGKVKSGSIGLEE